MDLQISTAGIPDNIRFKQHREKYIVLRDVLALKKKEGKKK